MKDFNQRDEFYLRTAQLAENLHAELAGRSPVKVDLDQPVSLRMLAEILRNPQGYGLDR
ncbi:hypothetical protein IB024_00200 [Brucella sp. 6810]|uniref:hypothetical protein n=1 Tax=Brucella sp. 6810 TaxID=2769351 RepID=UPI00165A947E|nr:hypothetical protein [Brucella sp. 6810]QNQ62223.1 hypothetical protein IB024_00200 [Brucella sp. 6810]